MVSGLLETVLGLTGGLSDTVLALLEGLGL